MKQTGKCPKCESSDLIRIPGQISAYGTGNNVPVGLFKTPVMVTRFVCAKCGFSEEWIDSSEEIERLREKYAE
jgi:predicted nucleic-acid-binding Zn-ribbon protein